MTVNLGYCPLSYFQVRVLVTLVTGKKKHEEEKNEE